MNDLMKLQHAEAQTIAAIDNATERLKGIGTDALSAALARFQAALDAASERLAGALPSMAGAVQGAIAKVQNSAAEIAAAFAPAEEVQVVTVTTCDDRAPEPTPERLVTVASQPAEQPGETWSHRGTKSDTTDTTPADSAPANRIPDAAAPKRRRGRSRPAACESPAEEYAEALASHNGKAAPA